MRTLRAMNLLAAAFCVLLFSLTVPMTRIAALEMPPLLVMSLRISGAGLLCALLMGIQRWAPPRRIWGPLALTSSSTVLVFSLVTALAFREVPGSHGALGLAALPAVTAIYSSLRDRSNPGLAFWCFALIGTLLSVSFFFSRAAGGLYVGDLLLGVGVLASMIGYVEGARMSREFGAVRIMSWSILMALPVVLALGAWLWSDIDVYAFSTEAWLSVAYLALISQSSAMFLWYRVLAKGPMQKVAMVQLMMPFLTLLANVVLLGENVGWFAWATAAGVVLCIFGAQRKRA
jgi:drug/metabolite transporter (DMT)-like permease